MAAAAATTAQAFRKLVRNGKYTTHTCGLGIELGRYAQANLVILPSKEAKDFHQFCELNPKPCPLLEIILIFLHMSVLVLFFFCRRKNRGNILP